jgi:hypothetical protein
VPVPYVSRQLGHSSIQVTVDLYGHFIPGAAMILMGDEVRRAQGGNNNAYCQDNETSWFDGTLVAKHADVQRHLLRGGKSQQQKACARFWRGISMPTDCPICRVMPLLSRQTVCSPRRRRERGRRRQAAARIEWLRAWATRASATLGLV